MKFDQGLGALGLLCFALALTLLLTIGIPISVFGGVGELDDWLGFAGNIVGAAMTVVAAFVAWRAVQPQVSAQREAVLVDLMMREEDRLETELHALTVLGDLTGTIVALDFSAEVSPTTLLTRLRDLGVSDVELKTRARIMELVGGPVPPTSLFKSTHTFSHLYRELVAETKRPPPLHYPTVALSRRGLSDSVERLLGENTKRHMQVLEMVRYYRSEIEARLTVPHR